MRKFTFFIENLIGALTSFPRAERRGILAIVLVIGVGLGWIVFRPGKPLDISYLTEADRLNDSLRADYYRRNYGSSSASPSANPARTFSEPRRPFGKQSVYIELNTADSARLCTVRGIGPVISANIVRYRSRLGGFIRNEQLKEVWGITSDNFEEISKQFFVDTTVIQKINLNFAPANSLRNHPYFTAGMVNRVVEARKLKGGWNQLRELVDHDILLPDEAEKVAPYVVFTAP